MTNGIPIYERTVNKNAPKRSAKEDKERVRNGIVNGRASIHDGFSASHARKVLPTLQAMLNLYRRELDEIVGPVLPGARKLNAAERKRLRLVKRQMALLAGGIEACSVLLGT